MMSSRINEAGGERVRRIERATEIPMLLLALIYLLAFVVVYLPDIPPELRRSARLVEVVVILVFAGELAIKIALAERRFAYLRSRWLDVLIVAIPFLRPLRILLILPVLARSLVGLNRVMGSYRGAYVLMVGVLTVLAGAGFIAVVEAGSGGPIDNFNDALWWAVTTITTVGYGDTYPVTDAGRVAASVMMVVGIALFGVLTAGIAAYFVETADEEDEERQEERMKQVLSKLEELEQQIEKLNRRLEAGTDRPDKAP